jgi:hypothetical protein
MGSAEVCDDVHSLGGGDESRCCCWILCDVTWGEPFGVVGLEE